MGIDCHFGPQEEDAEMKLGVQKGLLGTNTCERKGES